MLSLLPMWPQVIPRQREGVVPPHTPPWTAPTAHAARPVRLLLCLQVVLVLVLLLLLLLQRNTCTAFQRW